MLNNIPIKISVMIMATCCSANCSEVAFKRLTENKAFHRAKATVMKCSVHASPLEISRFESKCFCNIFAVMFWSERSCRIFLMAPTWKILCT